MIKKWTVFAATFAGAMLLPALALAEDEGSASSAGLIALGAGIGLGLAAFGAGLGQGRAAASALEGVGRNPSASGKMLAPMILCLAFIEALAIYSLIIAFTLSGKIH